MSCEDCFDGITQVFLRVGTAVKALSLMGMLLTLPWGNGGDLLELFHYGAGYGKASQIASVLPKATSAMQNLALPLAILFIFNIMGTMMIGLFSTRVDAERPGVHRLFKMGVKLTLLAVILDVLGLAAFGAYFWMSKNFLSTTQELGKFMSAGTYPYPAVMSIVLQALAYFVYGNAFWQLEYFFEGRNSKPCSWIVFLLFKLTGIAGLTSLFTLQTSVWPVVQFVTFALMAMALVASVVWSIPFESNYYDEEDEAEENGQNYQLTGMA